MRRSRSPLRAIQWGGVLSTAGHLRQLFAQLIAGGQLSGGAAAGPALNSAMKRVAAGDSPQLAVALFDAMRKVGVSPDDYTFTFAIKAAARLRIARKGAELHSLSLKLGFGGNSFVQNPLIHFYSACRAIENARQVFDLMPLTIRDVISWNSMISGYVQNDRYSDALYLFDEMSSPRSSIVIDSTTFVLAVKACGRSGSAAIGRRIHAAIIARGFDLDIFLSSSLIDMYAKCGRLDESRKVFDEIPERNTVCWSSMISGYLQNSQFTSSLELFREMQIAGVEPDEAAVTSVLSACGQLGALSQGIWIHSLCAANGLEDRLKVKNALIDMYSKCGEIERARQVFDEMPHRRDVFSWTALIGGLAANGESTMALDIFSQMQRSGNVSPNGITFLAVLSACSHGGFVERGFRYFGEMISVHKIRPEIQHYGCMVDLLGRSNLLPEMELFIRKMPMRPDAIIWRSLIFACRNCLNVEVAEAAALRIVESDSTRIMLAGVYASAERWKEVNSARGGIAKKPGCSSIEVDGVVFEFSVSARHRLMDRIRETLWTLREVAFETAASQT